MNHSNFYGADFGLFDSSNSNSTLTLKFDECEAITESSTSPSLDSYNNTNNQSSADGSTLGMMDSLKDNPMLTTASMPIPTRNLSAGGTGPSNQNLCRMPIEFGLDFDLSQDLNMPQLLLMDGTDLNEDSSPTLFGLGHNSYGAHSGGGSTSGDAVSAFATLSEQSRPIDVVVANSSRGNDFNTQTGGFLNNHHHNNNNSSQHQQHSLATMSAGQQMWGSDANSFLTNTAPFIAKSEPLNLDDDAIFQVDKADLIQGTHFNDDPLLDISIDDISLLEENHSLQPLHTVISPGGGSSNSPSGYAAVPNHNYYHLQHQQQQQQQCSPQPQSNQSLSVHSPPESVSLYETLNRRSPYNMNMGPIVSPPTPTNSLTNHFQAASGSASSPRARPISMSQPNTSQQLATRKYKTNAAHQHTKRSALHDLLRKETGDPSASMLGQSVPGGSGLGGGQAQAALVAHRHRLAQYHHMQNSRLSTSAPTQLGMDQLWQRREPRPHLLSTSSVAEAESTSSLSTGGVLSPEAPDFSQDDSDDSDHYEDFSSDDDSDEDDDKLSKSLESNSGGGGSGRKMTKRERFFWQYNVQAKGPKGQRLVIKTEMEDPHVLNEVTDPVFSPNCSVRGIKHSGKARKGDGNDLTPNPRKLNSIGRELDKLFRIINDITPVSELPFNARTKTRKEKNKLASRACRLKKKAQHEANKIKLYGLEVEHKRLISGIAEMKSIITTLTNSPGRETQEETSQKIDRVYQGATRVKIGGMSTEYVNQMIQKVKGSDRIGFSNI